MTTADLVAGFDLGTSSLKGVVLDGDGGVAARAEAAYPTTRPGPGMAEQNPADWMAAVRSVAGRLAEESPASRWAGIGLSGMIPTLVTLDGSGQPVGLAITWEDARAEAEGRAFREGAGPLDLYRRTGQWVDGRYLLPMFAWILANDPSRADATVSLAGAKDHLYHQLTGRLVTDPSTATGFGCYALAAGEWAPGLVRAALPDGAEPPGLPDVEPSSVSAPLTREAAGALGLPPGLPVHVGAADSVCAAAGLGVRRPGEVAYVAGTSTVILGVAADLHFDDAHRYLVTPLAHEGWGLEMDLLSTGSAVRWLAGLFGLGDGGEEAIVRLAAEAPAGSRGLSFLPFLARGEQGAVWDPSLRGTIGGLTTAHGRAEVARSLLEGIVLESRRCLSVLDEVPGLACGEVAVAGWPGESDLVPQMLADATGRPVRTGPGGDAASAAGAALLVSGGPAPGTRDRPPDGRSYHPSVEGRAEWTDLWSRHVRAMAAVRSSAM